METPACQPTQHERQRALRQQARAGDPVAQAQVDALNAANRASAAKAKAAGRTYADPAREAARRAKRRAQKQADRLLTLPPVELAQVQQRRARRAAAKQKREAAAAAPLEPVLSAAERAAQAKALNLARNRAAYRARQQRIANGDPDARAKYEQRLAYSRQRNAAQKVKLTPDQRSEIARQGAFKRWGKRAALDE